MSTAREVLGTVRGLSAVEFLVLAGTLSIEPNTLMRIVSAPVPLESTPVVASFLDIHTPVVSKTDGHYIVEVHNIGEKIAAAIRIVRDFALVQDDSHVLAGLKGAKDFVDHIRNTGDSLVLGVNLSWVTARDLKARLDEVGTSANITAY